MSATALRTIAFLDRSVKFFRFFLDFLEFVVGAVVLVVVGGGGGGGTCGGGTCGSGSGGSAAGLDFAAPFSLGCWSLRRDTESFAAVVSLVRFCGRGGEMEVMVIVALTAARGGCFPPFGCE